jgi:hypothetical protein
VCLLTGWLGWRRQAQVAKPRLAVRKYGWRGQPPKPDCVEVTCREIFDMLLWDPAAQCFRPERLPPPPPRPSAFAAAVAEREGGEGLDSIWKFYGDQVRVALCPAPRLT